MVGHEKESDSRRVREGDTGHVQRNYRRVNLRLNPKKIDTKGFLTDSGRICHFK